MQFARVIIKQTPLSVIMRLKHRQRETPFTTRIDPRFRDIQKFNDSISFPNSPEMIILT